MFENIGSKLKSVASLSTIVGIIFSCIFGIIIMLGNFLTGFIVAIVGSLLSWLGSLTMYGLGQLVENTDSIAQNTKRQNVISMNSDISNSGKRSNNFLSKQLNDPIRSEIDYSCRNIKASGSFTKGMCLVCHTVHEDLEYCTIDTNNGMKDMYICKECKEYFKNNSIN